MKPVLPVCSPGAHRPVWGSLAAAVETGCPSSLQTPSGSMFRCPQMGYTNLVNKPRRSDSILIEKFHEHSAFSEKWLARRGRLYTRLDQTKTNSVIPPISLSGYHQWKAVLRPKHLPSGLSLVVPPLNAPLRTEGRRRRHAAKIDLAIFDSWRSV